MILSEVKSYSLEKQVSININQAVGKTSIIQRFITDKYYNNFSPSLTASFNTKKVFFEKQKKMMKFEIWDTAGQEQYRSMTRAFYNRNPVHKFKKLKLLFWSMISQGKV